MTAAGAASPLSISTELYWILPTPRAFVDEVERSLLANKIVTVRLPGVEIPGLHRALEGALEHVQLGRPKWLKIEKGMDVGIQIGTALERQSVEPEELAVLESCPVRSVVLEAVSAGASKNCAQYLNRLATASPSAFAQRTHPHVLALLPEDIEPLEPAITASPGTLRFSGALTGDEMAAYVGMRMTTRLGPGKTELYRRLVTEFAGFDVGLAERLIAFSDEALLNLPESLEPLAAEADSRWRSGVWAALCYAEFSGRRVRHTLHEIHLARLANFGVAKREALDSLKRKYWRACVKSLMPYFEEHRASVMSPLRAALEEHARPTEGRIVRPTFSGRVETKSIDEIEYNDVHGLVKHEHFHPSGGAKTREAIEICSATKRVRDDLAHLRQPRPDAILKVTSLFEQFLKQG